MFEESRAPNRADCWLWIAVAAYGAHMIEEGILDWKTWVKATFGMNAEWSEFYLVNAVVALFGICCAIVGRRLLGFSLAFPAFMLVNAIFLHIIPTIVTGHYSPGLVTAVALFLPIGTGNFVAAARQGDTTAGRLAISWLTAAGGMALPLAAQAAKMMMSSN